jgi:hypothetical protein
MPEDESVVSMVDSRFGLALLDRDPSSIAAIAPDGRIAWVNEGWKTFARVNGAEGPTIQVGADYFDAIRGEVRSAFEAAASSCLAGEEPFVQEYECSSATLFRAYQLRMVPLSRRALLLVHSLIEERPQDRRPEPPDESRYRDEAGLIAQCMNCRRVRARADRSWHWVPEWAAETPVRVTHVLCAVCRGFYWPPRKTAGTTTAGR